MTLFDRPLVTSQISSRAIVVFCGAAALGAAVMITRLLLPRDILARAALLAVAQDSFGYFVLGLATRFGIQHHRSRLQILVLLGAVAAVEGVRFRRGEVITRTTTWIAGSIAVCVGVILAKWALEPGALSGALASLKSG